MKALLSVFNKAGIVELAKRMTELGIELIATNGTASVISKHDLPVKRVSDFTGVAEMPGGGIKTLHPAVHSAIATGEIGFVVVNLIPIKSLATMDIGGVALIRSAIKNIESTAVVVNPGRYRPVIDEYAAKRALSFRTRLELACEASKYICEYDTKLYRILSDVRSSDVTLHPYR